MATPPHPFTEWNEQIADFVQWNFEYDMCVKMRFFGDEAVRDFASVALGSTPIPTSVVRLEELPDPFTREDYLNRRQQHGLSTNGDPWGTIRSWRGVAVRGKCEGCINSTSHILRSFSQKPYFSQVVMCV